MLLNSKHFYEKLIFAKTYTTCDLKKTTLTRNQKKQIMPPRQKTQKPLNYTETVAWNADENIEMYWE